MAFVTTSIYKYDECKQISDVQVPITVSSLLFWRMPKRSRAKISRSRSRTRAPARKIARITRPVTGHFPSGPPLYQDVVLKYVEYKANASVTTVAEFNTWSMNGLYDPNITGTGHQPRFFDQYMALYGVYCVRGAKITAEVYGSGATGLMVANCVRASAHAPSVESPVTLAEQSNSILTTQSINEGSRRLTMYRSCADILGVSKDDYLADNTHWGDVSSNPTHQCYFSVAQQSADQSTTASTNMLVTIKYYVRFFRRNNVAAS